MSKKRPSCSRKKPPRCSCFPKKTFDRNDKEAIMEEYHAACGSCHVKTGAEGRRPDRSSACAPNGHNRKLKASDTDWKWAPIFNYAQHNEHLKGLEKSGLTKEKTCEKCHHKYNEKTKKLVYEKNTETPAEPVTNNKPKRTPDRCKKSLTAECIGCHMEMAEKWAGNKNVKVGPFECAGCHSEHKTLTAEAILKIPRLDRGQKDFVDVAVKDPKAARMKRVGPSITRPTSLEPNSVTPVITILWKSAPTAMRSASVRRESHQAQGRRRFLRACVPQIQSAPIMCGMPRQDQGEKSVRRVPSMAENGDAQVVMPGMPPGSVGRQADRGAQGL